MKFNQTARVLCWITLAICFLMAQSVLARVEPPQLGLNPPIQFSSSTTVVKSLDVTFGLVPGGANITIFPSQATCTNFALRVTELATGTIADYPVVPLSPTFIPDLNDSGEYQIQAFGYDLDQPVSYASHAEVLESHTAGTMRAPTTNGVLNIMTLSDVTSPFITLTALLDSLPLGCAATPGDFEVFEDGVSQQDYLDIDVSSTSSRILDMVILFDSSGSMQPYVDAVKENISNFAYTLADSNIDFRLALVRFGNYADPGQEPTLINGGAWTSDAQDFIDNYLTQVDASGGIEMGIQAVIDACDGYTFRPGANRFFLLISDEDSDGGDLTEACQKTNALGVSVNVAVDCGFGSSGVDYCGPGSISDCTNGLQFPVVGPYDQIFDELIGRANQTVAVRYRTANLTPGVEHQVMLTFDGCGLGLSDTASYFTGESPYIVRTPDTAALSDNPQLENVPLVFRAEVTDNVAPYANDVTLFFRTTGSGQPFNQMAMTDIGGDIWEAVLPGISVMNPGLDYYLRAFDGTLSGTDPQLDPTLYPYQIAVLPNVAPVITHTPVTTLTPGTAIPIQCDATDQTNFVQGVMLRARVYGDVLWTDIPMFNVGGDTYAAEIPDYLVVGGGVEYEILATDDFGVSAIAGPYQIIPPACVDVSVGTAEWDGSTMTVRFPIMIQNLSGHSPVFGVDLVMDYDPAVLDPVGIDVLGTVLDGAGWSTMMFAPNPGELRVAMSGTSEIPADGTLLYIDYNVLQAVGMGDCSALALHILLNEGDPCVNVVPPSPWCIPPALVTGTVNFWSCADTVPVPDAQVVLSNCCYADTATTTANGNYEAEGWYGDCYDLRPSKADGETMGISALDASLVMKNFVGLDPLDDCPIAPMTLQDGSTCPDSTVYPQMLAADVSGNGSIHSFDASIILKYLVGEDVSGTLVGSWGFVCENRPVCINGNGVTDQDFVGVLYGDVSGNYNTIPIVASSSARIVVGTVVGSPGEIVEVPVEIQGNMSFQGAILTIENPADQATVEGVSLGNLVNGSMSEWNYDQGVLKIALASMADVHGDGVICTIRYHLASDAMTDIELSGGDSFLDENPSPISMDDGAITLGVSAVGHSDLPKEFGISDVAPNPFNPTTTIYFDVPQSGGKVTLKIFDIQGRLVKTLVSSDFTMGVHQVIWNGKNDSGASVPSGTYFCRMQAPGKISTVKMVLVK